MAKFNPFFQQQLGKGISKAGPRHLTPMDLTAYLNERAQYIKKARARDAECRAAGYPSEGIDEVFRVFALIPQETTWVP